ncbi:MAG: GAF domain-containing protein [Thermomicrobiales bacterium]
MMTQSVRDAPPMPLGGQNALLESFSAIAEALTSSGDLATVLQCIAEEALHLLHATSARVRMPDASGAQLLLAALADDANAATRLPPPDAISHLQTDSIAGKAFRTNQIYVARGAPRRGVPEEQYALHCTVPLTTRNRALGVLTVWRANEQPFSENEVAVVRIFGNAAALAIEQVRLLTEERDRTRRMETLTEVARIISAATEGDALYEAVYAQCVRLFGVEHFYIARTTPDGQLVPVLWYSYAHRLREQEAALLPPSLGQCVIQDNVPINTADAGEEYRRRGLPAPPGKQWGEGVHTYHMPWIGVPIREGDHAAGVIATNGRATPYTDEECAVLLAIADQVGVAIRNIDLLEAQRDRAARMTTLADVSRAISAVTDPDELYGVVYRECSRLLPMANSRICRIVPETGEVFAECYFRHGVRVRELEGRILRGGLSPVIRDTGQPMMTNDYAAELVKRGMALVNTPLPPPHSSWLGVPVIQGDEVYGIISLNTTERRRTTEDRDTLLAIANRVGIAMANARLITRERTRATRMATLTEIARSISATTDRETLYNAVYVQCARLFAVESLRITRVNAETGEQVPEFWYIDGVRRSEREGIPLRYGLSFIVAETRQPFHTDDYYTERIARGIPVSKPVNGSAAFEAKAWLGVPMLAGDTLLGVIAIYGKRSAYTADEEEAFIAIVNQVSVALQNVELIERERSRVERFSVLSDMSRAMSAVLDMDELLHVIQRETPRLFPSQSLLVAYWNAERTWFHEESRDESVKVLPFAEMMQQRALTRQVVESGETFITHDYEREMQRRGETTRSYAYITFPTGWVGVPLRAKERTIGIIAAFTRKADLTMGNVRILELIARQAAIALENARLLERERTRAERLAILNDISRTISAVLDLEPLLGAIARECMRLVDVHYPLIGYRAATGWITAMGVSGAIGHHERATGVGPLATIVMETRTPLFVADYAAACHERGLAPATLPGLELPLGWIGVPMIVGAQVVGVLAGFIAAEHATAESAQLLSIMANQAAIATENARLYHDAQELGVVEERNRLAREIHDTIAQGLTATTYQLELADTFLAMEPPKLDRVQEKLHRSLALTRANLEEARRSVMDLRAAHLQNVTLTEAFERLAATFTNDAGVVVTVTAAEDFPALPSPVSAGLYRIGQEALANIAKHARATLVEMSLGIEEGVVLLTIHDDGVGFDPEVVATQRTARGTSGGFGLIGIRERAQLLGGTSDVWSDVGAGTQIVVRVPIPL